MHAESASVIAVTSGDVNDKTPSAKVMRMSYFHFPDLMYKWLGFWSFLFKNFVLSFV